MILYLISNYCDFRIVFKFNLSFILNHFDFKHSLSQLKLTLLRYFNFENFFDILFNYEFNFKLLRLQTFLKISFNFTLSNFKIILKTEN